MYLYLCVWINLYNIIILNISLVYQSYNITNIVQCHKQFLIYDSFLHIQNLIHFTNHIKIFKTFLKQQVSPCYESFCDSIDYLKLWTVFHKRYIDVVSHHYEFV